MNVIGILGFAGTGKDTVFKILEQHGFQRMAFADHLKRVCMDIFQFTYEQMWGSQKEEPDFRYPREHTWEQKVSLPHLSMGGHTLHNPAEHIKCLCCGWRLTDLGPQPHRCYLTPRYAMQLVGTEGARAAWGNIWVRRALENAQHILNGAHYIRERGLDFGAPIPAKGVIFTDNRFINEVEALFEAGGRVYRIKRPGFEQPRFDHASETEQLQIPDDRLSGVIMNDKTLEDLDEAVLNTVRLT